MENKSIWGKILNIVITVLTAIATTFGVPPASACKEKEKPLRVIP